MPAPSSILNKIKLLLNLSSSSNTFEAENAKVMADKLIAKYEISEEELSSLRDDKPLYGESEKLFETDYIQGWKNQLAFGVGKKFDCYIVQETAVPTEGSEIYTYFVLGDPEDVEKVLFSFNAFVKKVENLIWEKCSGQDGDYISSYYEGVVAAIKSNLEWEQINIPNQSVRNIKKIAGNDKEKAAIAKVKTEKEKPLESSVDIASQSLIKNVVAYFRGMTDGKDLSLQDIVELEGGIQPLFQME